MTSYTSKSNDPKENSSIENSLNFPSYPLNKQQKDRLQLVLNGQVGKIWIKELLDYSHQNLPSIKTRRIKGGTVEYIMRGTSYKGDLDVCYKIENGPLEDVSKLVSVVKCFLKYKNIQTKVVDSNDFMYLACNVKIGDNEEFDLTYTKDPISFRSKLDMGEVDIDKKTFHCSKRYGSYKELQEARKIEDTGCSITHLKSLRESVFFYFMYLFAQGRVESDDFILELCQKILPIYVIKGEENFTLWLDNQIVKYFTYHAHGELETQVICLIEMALATYIIFTTKKLGMHYKEQNKCLKAMWKVIFPHLINCSQNSNLLWLTDRFNEDIQSLKDVQYYLLSIFRFYHPNSCSKLMQIRIVEGKIEVRIPTGKDKLPLLDENKILSLLLPINEICPITLDIFSQVFFSQTNEQTRIKGFNKQIYQNNVDCRRFLTIYTNNISKFLCIKSSTHTKEISPKLLIQCFEKIYDGINNQEPILLLEKIYKDLTIAHLLTADEYQYKILCRCYYSILVKVILEEKNNSEVLKKFSLPFISPLEFFSSILDEIRELKKIEDIYTCLKLCKPIIEEVIYLIYENENIHKKEVNGLFLQLHQFFSKLLFCEQSCYREENFSVIVLLAKILDDIPLPKNFNSRPPPCQNFPQLSSVDLSFYEQRELEKVKLNVYIISSLSKFNLQSSQYRDDIEFLIKFYLNYYYPDRKEAFRMLFEVFDCYLKKGLEKQAEQKLHEMIEKGWIFGSDVDSFLVKIPQDMVTLKQKLWYITHRDIKNLVMQSCKDMTLIYSLMNSWNKLLLQPTTVSLTDSLDLFEKLLDFLYLTPNVQISDPCTIVEWFDSHTTLLKNLSEGVERSVLKRSQKMKTKMFFLIKGIIKKTSNIDNFLFKKLINVILSLNTPKSPILEGMRLNLLFLLISKRLSSNEKGLIDHKDDFNNCLIVLHKQNVPIDTIIKHFKNRISDKELTVLLNVLLEDTKDIQNFKPMISIFLNIYNGWEKENLLKLANLCVLLAEKNQLEEKELIVFIGFLFQQGIIDSIITRLLAFVKQKDLFRTDFLNMILLKESITQEDLLQVSDENIKFLSYEKLKKLICFCVEQNVSNPNWKIKELFNLFSNGKELSCDDAQLFFGFTLICLKNNSDKITHLTVAQNLIQHALKYLWFPNRQCLEDLSLIVFRVCDNKNNSFERRSFLYYFFLMMNDNSIKLSEELKKKQSEFISEIISHQVFSISLIEKLLNDKDKIEMAELFIKHATPQNNYLEMILKTLKMQNDLNDEMNIWRLYQIFKKIQEFRKECIELSELEIKGLNKEHITSIYNLVVVGFVDIQKIKSLDELLKLQNQIISPVLKSEKENVFGLLVTKFKSLDDYYKILEHIYIHEYQPTKSLKYLCIFLSKVKNSLVLQKSSDKIFDQVMKYFGDVNEMREENVRAEIIKLAIRCQGSANIYLLSTSFNVTSLGSNETIQSYLNKISNLIKSYNFNELLTKQQITIDGNHFLNLIENGLIAFNPNNHSFIIKLIHFLCIQSSKSQDIARLITQSYMKVNIKKGQSQGLLEFIDHFINYIEEIEKNQKNLSNQTLVISSLLCQLPKFVKDEAINKKNLAKTQSRILIMLELLLKKNNRIIHKTHEKNDFFKTYIDLIDFNLHDCSDVVYFSRHFSNFLKNIETFFDLLEKEDIVKSKKILEMYLTEKNDLSFELCYTMVYHFCNILSNEKCLDYFDSSINMKKEMLVLLKRKVKTNLQEVLKFLYLCKDTIVMSNKQTSLRNLSISGTSLSEDVKNSNRNYFISLSSFQKYFLEESENFKLSLKNNEGINDLMYLKSSLKLECDAFKFFNVEYLEKNESLKYEVELQEFIKKIENKDSFSNYFIPIFVGISSYQLFTKNNNFEALKWFKKINISNVDDENLENSIVFFLSNFINKCTVSEDKTIVEFGATILSLLENKYKNNKIIISVFLKLALGIPKTSEEFDK